MSDRTTAEIFAALFFAFGAAGGEAFRRHTSLVIHEALRAGVINDPDARTFLGNLADVADQQDEELPSPS
jgi:hypothetical protein